MEFIVKIFFYFLNYESMKTFIGNLENTEQDYISFYILQLSF